MNGILRCMICALVTLAPVFAQPAHSGSPTQTARANFVNQQGEQVGTATVTQTPNGVLVTAEITGLPPGEHGFHIHETGRCDPTAGFESAGDHYAPGGHKHGYFVEGGPHAGDMPNQFVGQDGRLRADVFNPNVTLDSGPSTLFDDDGSAIIVHANADDYRSQPSGDAGGRLACAAIQRR
jgi:superoxide dismutase, Cu-Zn family